MLKPDFKEFAALLNSYKVEYLIVGDMRWSRTHMPVRVAFNRGACLSPPLFHP